MAARWLDALEAQLALPGGTGAPRVLVVDDEPDILDSVADMLGFGMPEAHILKARDAQAAMQVLTERRVDVVLSDLKMPHTDGIMLLSQVGKKYPRCRRILMTAYREANLEERAQAVGVTRVLHKPHDLDLVAEAVKAELDASD